MINESKKSPVKDIRLRIVSSQDQKLDDLKYYAKKEFRVVISKTALIRIAIFELIDMIKSKDELKRILKKHGYI